MLTGALSAEQTLFQLHQFLSGLLKTNRQLVPLVVQLILVPQLIKRKIMTNQLAT